MTLLQHAFTRPAFLGLSATCLLAASAVFAPPASAHRPAVGAEKDAMIYQASGRYFGGVAVAEPRSAPLKCFVADVSTVAGAGQWGAWTFSSFAGGHPGECRAANGVVTEHRIDGRWYVLWESSDGYPPTHNRRIGSHTYLGVPRSIAKDLVAGLQSP
jgi:hypothetical protein